MYFILLENIARNEYSSICLILIQMVKNFIWWRIYISVTNTVYNLLILATYVIVYTITMTAGRIGIKTHGSESRGQGGSTLRWPLDECM